MYKAIVVKNPNNIQIVGNQGELKRGILQIDTVKICDLVPDQRIDFNTAQTLQTFKNQTVVLVNNLRFGLEDKN